MIKANIVIATDKNYLHYAENLMKSLFVHHQDIEIFLLNTGDIPSEWASHFSHYLEQRNITLKLATLPSQELEQFKISGYITQATYLRYYIEYLFQYSECPRWIYLDCDIIVNGDITTAFDEYRFDHYAIGAVSDPYVNSLEHSFKNKDYFNAGVLYINASQYGSIKADLVKLTQNLSDEIKFGDQDILNTYFKDNWLQLSHSYNFQSAHMVRHKCNKKDNLSPKIIHFTGNPKPLEITENWNDYFANDIIALFKFYHHIPWQVLANLPLGFAKLEV